VHGFTLTCIALRAISAMPGIGISRHAAHLQVVILRPNGRRWLPRCWPPGTRGLQFNKFLRFLAHRIGATRQGHGLMYKRILLAYDGSVEGRTALREGALLAKQCGAEVFLLSVLADIGTLLLSEVTLAGATVQMEEDFHEILQEGVARLKKLGFDPVAKLVRGLPAEEIGKFAQEVGADLIVVGHRRQSAFDRWWSGPKGAYLMDFTDCSLLVARNAVTDEAIEALLVPE
jgi:nucleotide-binding universal stress UspA family protein